MAYQFDALIKYLQLHGFLCEASFTYIKRKSDIINPPLKKNDHLAIMTCLGNEVASWCFLPPASTMDRPELKQENPIRTFG